MKGYELAKRAAELILDKKGFDVKIINIKGLSSSCDYFVLGTGGVDQHVKAIADNVRKELSREGEKPIGYEGQSNAHWVLLDYADVVVHVFDPEYRRIYHLEDLWKDAEIEVLNDEE